MSKLNVHQRILAVMKEAHYIKKDAKVGFGNNAYSATSHDAVTTKIAPLFVKHGLVAIPTITDHTCERYRVATRNGEAERYETKVFVSLKIVNADCPEEYVETNAFAHGFDTQDKSPGKAYSMAVKYCYLKALMIASGDKEEDRPEESHVIPSKPQKPAKMSVNSQSFKIGSKSVGQLRDEVKELLTKAGKYSDTEDQRATVMGMTEGMLVATIEKYKEYK